MFALETAMDELAYKLNMDPITLRKINEPRREPVSGKEHSNRRLIQCLETGAKKFGWARRNFVPGQRREGEFLVGMGVAAAVYPLKGSPTRARCRILADGSAVVASGTHEIGTGVSTITRQIAADALGISVTRVRFEHGDTVLPVAPITGGSTTTMWVGTAVHNACLAAREQLFTLARQANIKTNANDYQKMLKALQKTEIEALAEAKPDENAKKKFAMESYAAHFCEVAIHTGTPELRVRRIVSVFNCGRIINPRTARSQFIGAITMGLGMALMEQTRLDTRDARWVNPDLAEYHVPVNADVANIEVSWLDTPDMVVNPLGAKGIGEIGIVSLAAAVSNAVFNATGRRIRELPITLDKLL